MILNRACSSVVQATPSSSPFVTGAWLRSLPADAKSGNMSKTRTARMAEISGTGKPWQSQF